MNHQRESSGRKHQGEFGREETRGIYGAIIGAVAGLASAGVGAYSSSRAASAASAGQGLQTKSVHPPGYIEGLQRYVAQLLAQNATAIPPSFSDYVQSGGTARFPLATTGINPVNARRLGLVGVNNEQVPYFDPRSDTKLTPEQTMFIYNQGERARQTVGAPVRRYGRLTNREASLQSMLDAGVSDPIRAERLRNKLATTTTRRNQVSTRLFGK